MKYTTDQPAEISKTDQSAQFAFIMTSFVMGIKYEHVKPNNKSF